MELKIDKQELSSSEEFAFAFSTGDKEQDIKINAETSLLFLSLGEPTDENINTFVKTTEFLFNKYNNTDSESIKNILTDIYKNKETSSVWRLISAKIVFGLYTSTIPESGLPLSHPHIKLCVTWAKTVIGISKIDYPLYAKCKLDACNWLAALYKRRGLSTSDNSLIQLSFQYYEKALEIINSTQESTYSDISSALLKIYTVRDECLSKDATLDDEETVKLIQVMEQVIEFHSNVPNDKKTMQKYVGPRHAMIELERCIGKRDETELNAEEEQLNKEEPPMLWWADEQQRNALETSDITMSNLGKLYAKIPKSRGEEPDYQKAVIWLDKASERKYQDVKDFLQTPEIQKAREEVKVKLAETIEITYDKLINLTNCYLNKSDIDTSKRESLENLKAILEKHPQQSKHESIIEFKNKLNTINREMLFAHRTDAWKRYVYNVFSVVTIIPAIVRMCDSFSKYSTLQFWKPESERAYECAVENISKLDLRK